MTRSRRLLVLVPGVVALTLVVAAIVGRARFDARKNRTYEVHLDAPVLPVDSAAIAKGDHLAHTIAGCAECHGADLGGQPMAEDPMMRLVAPNLTRGRGSVVADYTPTDWARAVVHGVRRDGRSLVVMPSAHLAAFSDEDLTVVYAYLHSAVPPVDRELPPTDVKPLGSVFLGLVGAPIFSAEDVDHGAPRTLAVVPGPTRAYGDYLVNVCRGCHGPELHGGASPQPGAPPAADISPVAMRAWTFDTFERALRTGKKRDGTDIDPAMPWGALRDATPDEMRALWLGLRQE